MPWVRLGWLVPGICSIDCCWHLAIGQAGGILRDPEPWVGCLRHLAGHALVLWGHGHEHGLRMMLLRLYPAVRRRLLLLLLLLVGRVFLRLPDFSRHGRLSCLLNHCCMGPT